MSNENINIRYNKFCKGPVQGTFCTINFENPNRPRLTIISQTGGIIRSFDILGGLSEDMLLSFEYVGPDKLNNVINDSYIYTLEKISEARCLFKKFSFNTTFGNLNLFHQKIFSDFGNYSFDTNSMCVEYHSAFFSKHSDRWVDSIYLNNVDRLREGDTIFIGPSNDPEYGGGYDVVRVEYIVRSEGRVFITPTIQNQYIIGDPVVFSPYYYIINNTGISGDSSRGSIIRVDNRNDSITNRDTKRIYQKVNNAVWCPFLNCIGMLFDTNIIYCNPYNYYINARSMFLNNYLRNKKDFYEIYDIVFMDDVCFKLSDTVMYRDDVGELHNYYWRDGNDNPIYNFQRQTMIPYVNTLNISSNDSYLSGSESQTTMFLKAMDQFGVGLRDVNLNCSIESGGEQSKLVPLSGYRETDINGEAELGFISHIDNDFATIKVESSEGSSYTGSVKIFARSSVWNEVNYEGNDVFINQFDNMIQGNPWPNGLIRQAYTLNMHYFLPEISLFGHSFFSSSGGNWVPDGNRELMDELLGFLVNKGEDQGFYYRWFSGGAGLTLGKFADAPTTGYSEYDDPVSIPNRITTVNRTNVRNYILTKDRLFSYHIDPPRVSERDYGMGWWSSLGDPWVDWFQDGFFDEDSNFYNRSIKIPEDTPVPRKSVHLVEEENSMRMSQLNHSLHSYYVDGVYSDELMTYVRIDQFIFVQDARPAFYSHKNPVFTDIWLRLRPFGSSLNHETLRMRIRKVSRFNDSGIIDITDELSIEYFDAGGGLDGIEITYDPPEWFEYNSIVYVYLEVYDNAGNIIKIDYWFTLIHDYRIPYILNMNPNRLESGVDPNTTVYFEVRDDETGVDINSLVVTVNSKVVFPQRIEKIDDHHYIVEYTPHQPFMYGTSVDVGVFVGDRAFQTNLLRDGYVFYIKESAAVGLIGYDPKPCIGGVGRYYDVRFLAIDLGDGVDKDKLRLQIGELDVTEHKNTFILPVIYRML